MALKILLADESNTIKKVFQLALQDYAVEVIAVHTGDEVKEVCEKINPDIIFIDILMQKINGYGVSADIKSNPQFSQTPIVLMWSSFITIDQDKFQASKADAELEKPFEIEKLREIIQNFVPKTQSQSVSQFLKMPDIKMEDSPSPSLSIVEPDVEELPEPSLSLINNSLDDFEEMALEATNALEKTMIEDSKQDELLIADEENNSEWVSSSIDDISTPSLSPDLDAPEEDQDWNSIAEKINTIVDDQISQEGPTQEETPSIHLDTPSNPGVDLADLKLGQTNIGFPVDQVSDTNIVQKTEKLIEEIVRAHLNEHLNSIIEAHSRKLIEDVVWKVVPDLATTVIDKEISRLLTKHGKDI